MPHRFPKEYLLKNYAMKYSSLGVYVEEGLKVTFGSVLPLFLMMRQATESYKISYENVGEALRRLALNEAYVVLSLGFDSSSYFNINGGVNSEAVCKDNVWTFNGARYYEMYGRGEASLIIMRRDEIPMADLVKNEAVKDADLITGSTPIYSNIRKVVEKSYMNVFYRIYVDVHYLKDMKFVRILIPNVFTSNKYDLDKVKKINF